MKKQTTPYLKKQKSLKKSEVLELNESYRKCIQWFFAYPDRDIGLTYLAEMIGVAKTTARKIVLKLIEEGFLFKEELGKVWRISCNKNHPYNHSVKIAFNLELAYQSGILPEIYKIVPNARAIILFGSYRKGDDTEKSDIDIAAEVIGNEDLRIIQLGILPQIGYRKNVAVNLHVFSRNKIDLNLFSNIINGIILEGFLEVGL
jgi:hypothetical protein